MEDWDGQYRRLKDALTRTQIVKAPKQSLHTFGVTKLSYYIVTEPAYQDLNPGSSEAVIREGSVTADRPTVVTPYYMANLAGFGDEALNYFNSLARQHGPNVSGLLYRYKNEPGEMNIVEGTVDAVAERISDQLSTSGSNLSVVIKGVDELWDVSLLKFIFEYTEASAMGNVGELQNRGLLDPDPQLEVPRAAIQHIDDLFRQVEEGDNPAVLKQELDRWGIFDYYQDRFLNLFRQKRG